MFTSNVYENRDNIRNIVCAPNRFRRDDDDDDTRKPLTISALRDHKLDDVNTLASSQINAEKVHD